MPKRRNPIYTPAPSGRRTTIHRKRFKDAWRTGIELHAASTTAEIAEHERRLRELAIDAQAPVVEPRRRDLDPEGIPGDAPLSEYPRVTRPETMIVEEPIEPVFEEKPRRKRVHHDD